VGTRGTGRALEFATLAKPVPAAQVAARFDFELVDSPAQALPRALAVAAGFGNYSPALVRQTKAALAAGSNQSFEQTMSVVGSLRAAHASAATTSTIEQERTQHAHR
jgi:hypothetical protein